MLVEADASLTEEDTKGIEILSTGDVAISSPSLEIEEGICDTTLAADSTISLDSSSRDLLKK